ncbi:hypothetical protein M407DRAFT_6723 [Tulasnella calospora MUT 4182]|uniref:Uncharacterized protein n=1 Tax=Tulasnella calospora MUT 4182 TaxID=1051891 RepID=A0A0C3M4G0_9AGAM|nr:hypothetical protein M407DRAFT_6723 [Tulasnella calospora MUT 4182]
MSQWPQHPNRNPKVRGWHWPLSNQWVRRWTGSHCLNESLKGPGEEVDGLDDAGADPVETVDNPPAPKSPLACVDGEAILLDGCVGSALRVVADVDGRVQRVGRIDKGVIENRFGDEDETGICGNREDGGKGWTLSDRPSWPGMGAFADGPIASQVDIVEGPNANPYVG